MRRTQESMLLADSSTRRLVVFSHPNHELAVFGLIQRVQPNLLYLTDGGGASRVGETRRGLAAIGIAERARFLDYSEGSFYAALLAHDIAFFRRVADDVRSEIMSVRAEQVLCDAVEFYNPVHDMALPLVLAALAGGAVPAFEVPVVYQRPAPGEVYETHRFPEPAGPRQVVLRLTEDELAMKLRARDEIYRELRAQFPQLVDVPAEHAAVEVVRKSTGSVPTPDTRRILRYERRGRLLQEQGAIERIITYADHYAPLVSMLGLN